jgi:hypothetical protein
MSQENESASEPTSVNNESADKQASEINQENPSRGSGNYLTVNKGEYALTFIDIGKHKTIVTFNPDGTMWINPDYNADEAAQAFWNAVLKLNPLNKAVSNINERIES